MDEIRPFWVVWNPSHGLPRYQHYTAEEARNEAKRLAALNPGQDFYVLGTIGKARRDEPVTWFDADPIPF